MNPYLLSAEWLTILTSGLSDGFLLALTSLAFALVYRIRVFRIDLAIYLFVGGAIPLTMFTSEVLSVQHLAAALAVAAIAGGISSGQERLLHWPLTRKGAGLLEQMVAAIGVYFVGASFLHVLYGSDPVVWSGEDNFHIRLLLMASLSGAGLLVLGLFSRGTSRLRLQYRAISDDPDLAFVLGVHVERIRIIASFAAGAMTALAGFLLGIDRAADIFYSLLFMTSAIAIVLICDRRSIRTLVFVSLLVGITQKLTGFLVGQLWSETILYLALVSSLFVRASAFLGKTKSMREWE